MTNSSLPYPRPDSLVSTEWLAQHLTAPDVRVVDASWYLPQMKRDPRAEYAASHIPGAVFFDIDEISDSESPLPHMLPSPEKFAARVRKLGLGDGNRIVVYDGSGFNMSAARVWWMFRAFGHRDVAVLDGGFKKWQREGRPTEDRPPMPRERHFSARPDLTLVRNLDQIRANQDTHREQVIDARSAGRFQGTEPEPRAGLKSGHIPGSLSLPFMRLTDPDSGTMLPAADLREALEAAGLNLSAPVICTCGSGVTACVIALALDLLGHRNYAVYDGSWTEWASRGDSVIETGPALAR